MSWAGMLRKFGIESNGDDVNIFRGGLIVGKDAVVKGDLTLTGDLVANGVNPLSGLASAVAYVKTDSGVKTFVAADADNDRVALVVVRVTEVFASVGGNQPTVKVGVTGADTSLAAAAIFTDAALGKVFVFAGALAKTKNLLVTLTAATGTSTGAIAVSAFVLPAAP